MQFSNSVIHLRLFARTSCSRSRFEQRNISANQISIVGEISRRLTVRESDRTPPGTVALAEAVRILPKPPFASQVSDTRDPRSEPTPSRLDYERRVLRVIRPSSDCLFLEPPSNGGAPWRAGADARPDLGVDARARPARAFRARVTRAQSRGSAVGASRVCPIAPASARSA